jgi:hypothetical protein
MVEDRTVVPIGDSVCMGWRFTPRRSCLRPDDRLDAAVGRKPGSVPCGPSARCRNLGAGRGWALWKALITFAGNLGTNQAGAATARRVIDEVLADHEQPS